MSPATEFLNLFERRWYCEVVRSGYHNGATCTSDDPHVGWNCAYRYEISLTESTYQKLQEQLDKQDKQD